MSTKYANQMKYDQLKINTAHHSVESNPTFEFMPLWQGIPWPTRSAKWTSDQCRVVLELPSESSKATQDAAPCTIRQLLIEFEESGIVEVCLHQHTCDRPGADVSTGWYHIEGISQSVLLPKYTKYICLVIRLNY